MGTTKVKDKVETKIAGEAPVGNLPAVQVQMQTFMAEFRARQRAYQPLLPPHVPFEKFEASVRAAVAKDPELVTKCIPATLFRAAAEAAELGLSLSPTLREADILKVWNSRAGGLEAQFRPRFIGFMKLAKQSGEIKNITATEVYEWDEFDYERGLHERLIHRPGKKPMDYHTKPQWGVIAAYCIWTEVDGTKKFEVMDLPDIIRIMNRTASKNKAGEIVGPWVNDFPEMCRKTVVRRSSKYMPLSAEKMKGFAAAVNLDDRREGGESVTLDHGDVVDITDDAPPAEEQKKPAQTKQAQSQMDDLESRMQGGGQKQQAAKTQPQTIDNQPQKKAIVKLDVPAKDGVKDWLAWLQGAEAIVKELPPESRAEWKAMHANLLDACEFNAPDAMGDLNKLLP